MMMILHVLQSYSEVTRYDWLKINRYFEALISWLSDFSLVIAIDF